MATQRQRIWGWWFFDWASQPYNTLLLTFIFGPYFAEVARGYYMGAGLEEEAAKAAAQAYWGYGLTIASVIIAVFAPILGAIADGTGRRLVWVWFFSAFYVVGAYGLWWVSPGGEADMLTWAIVFFGIGFIGMEFSTIFTNALMPTLTDGDDIGAISGSGFAFGYLGGLLALIVMLCLFAENAATGKTLIGIDPLFGLDPEAREGTRAVGPITAIWFAVFMVPFFLWVKEPKMPRGRVNIGAALGSLTALIAAVLSVVLACLPRRAERALCVRRGLRVECAGLVDHRHRDFRHSGRGHRDDRQLDRWQDGRQIRAETGDQMVDHRAVGGLYGDRRP